MSVVNKVVVKNVAYDIEDARTKQALSVEVTRAKVKEDELEEELENVQNKLNTKESVTEVSWGASSNMNSFTTAGVYNIKGERTNANDNLPISNSNPGHTISGRLIVLDSSINGTGDSQDKCITQLLTLSNRTGEDGNTYIRTASGASLRSLTWKPWATQQTNVNVGQVASLDSFIDNGIYSGVFVESGVPSTFVMVVINDYFVGVSPRRVSQFLYKLSKTGEVSYTTRIGVGDGTITWNGWEIINKKELDATETELLSRIQGTSANSSASNDPFKRYPTNFSSVADAEFMEALNTMHSTDSTSGVDGFWRLYIGRLAVEVKNVAIKYVDDTWVQTIKLPYKWYKSSNKFGIDDDGNHHIHTYYRIHKDGSWGDWIEVEEELKSAITAEENRAKAEETAIRKLITDLIGESPETLDSIHEISSWILNDKTGAAAMATKINQLNDVTEGLANALGEEVNRATEEESTIKSKSLHYDSIHFIPNVDTIRIGGKSVDGSNTLAKNIPAATTEFAGVMTAEDKKVLNEVKRSSATKVTWNSSSNMNNFKTPGVYEIYGERTRQDDNLPILNASPGHSIAARLTVVASTLQPDQVETCVTQFLQLSNRVGGEGATYVRTYNENNNGMNGWSSWRKQMGMVETLINSNDVTVGQEIFNEAAAKIGDGLNGMIDNGMYSGIYIDNLNYTGTRSLYYLSAPPTFVETFVLVVINDYAASGKLDMQRHITQLKYAVDAITGQSTVKKRVGTGNDTVSWSDWEDINNITIDDEVTTASINPVQSQAIAKAIEEGEKRVLRRLFVAAGAEYNDTDSVIEKAAPWGTEETWVKNDDGTYTYTETPAIVQHLPKHYYLNGLGDITEEQMMDIYKYSFPVLGATDWTNAFREVNVRTNLFYKQYYSAARVKTLAAAFNANKTIEIINFNNQGAKVVLNDAASWNYAFGSCTKLKRILGVLDINNASSLLGSNCDSLIHVQLYNLNKNLLLFNKSNNIDKESVLYAIQNSTPTSAITITLHPDAYSRLADDADIVAALEAQPLITLVSA